MKRKVFIIKLYDFSDTIICQSYEEVVENIDILIDKDLYDTFTIGKLQNCFNCCEYEFYDKVSGNFIEYEIDEYNLNRLKKKYNQNLKYKNIWTAPFIEYIISYDFIDYTDKYIDTIYPQIESFSYQTKLKYRERILNSKVNKSIKRITSCETLSELDIKNIDIASCITDEEYTNDWLENNKVVG